MNKFLLKGVVAGAVLLIVSYAALYIDGVIYFRRLPKNTTIPSLVSTETSRSCFSCTLSF